MHTSAASPHGCAQRRTPLACAAQPSTHLVDGDEDDLHEEANQAHRHKAHSSQPRHLAKLLLQQSKTEGGDSRRVGRRRAQGGAVTQPAGAACSCLRRAAACSCLRPTAESCQLAPGSPDSAAARCSPLEHAPLVCPPKWRQAAPPLTEALQPGAAALGLSHRILLAGRGQPPARGQTPQERRPSPHDRAPCAHPIGLLTPLDQPASAQARGGGIRAGQTPVAPTAPGSPRPPAYRTLFLANSFTLSAALSISAATVCLYRRTRGWRGAGAETRRRRAGEGEDRTRQGAQASLAGPPAARRALSVARRHMPTSCFRDCSPLVVRSQWQQRAEGIIILTNRCSSTCACSGVPHRHAWLMCPPARWPPAPAGACLCLSAARQALLPVAVAESGSDD